MESTAAASDMDGQARGRSVRPFALQPSVPRSRSFSYTAGVAAEAGPPETAAAAAAAGATVTPGSTAYVPYTPSPLTQSPTTHNYWASPSPQLQPVGQSRSRLVRLEYERDQTPDVDRNTNERDGLLRRRFTETSLGRADIIQTARSAPHSRSVSGDELSTGSNMTLVLATPPQSLANRSGAELVTPGSAMSGRGNEEVTYGKGEHLMVWRGDPDDEDGAVGYWHHGIDCGDGTVIHYTGIDGVKSMNLGRIGRTAMTEFQWTSPRVHIVEYTGTQRRKLLPPDEVVERAESKIGHSRYNIISDNCETFARWCKTGEHVSHQAFGLGFALLAGIYVNLTGSTALMTVVCAFSAYKLWDRAHNRARERRGRREGSSEAVVPARARAARRDTDLRD
ncbi:hypothetical protein FVE85_6947 [Porphyridium purpureum]|uniref:LRAT domain-containing protein n=1 Tax=Porphyridium purpureum TaxID=35688 RepID=A0A5J4Z8I6_PORPP|nr:hypothetical protein FVE85_6947 [Porphyridium purpureum]|eukprot:POR1476..scf295_1